MKLYEKAKSSSSMAQPALIIIYPSRIMHLLGTAYSMIPNPRGAGRPVQFLQKYMFEFSGEMSGCCTFTSVPLRLDQSRATELEQHGMYHRMRGYSLFLPGDPLISLPGFLRLSSYDGCDRPRTHCPFIAASYEEYLRTLRGTLRSSQSYAAMPHYLFVWGFVQRSLSIGVGRM